MVTEKDSKTEPTEGSKRGPVIHPAEFSGSGDWTTWIRKFNRLAELYSWSDSEKLIWLESKLTGQAGRAFETLATNPKKRILMWLWRLLHHSKKKKKTANEVLIHQLICYSESRAKSMTDLTAKSIENLLNNHVEITLLHLSIDFLT